MQCASAPWDIMRICDFSLLLSRFLCTVSNIYYSYNFRNSGSSGLSKPLKEEPVIDYFDVQDWSHWCRITAQKLTGEDNKSLQKVLLVTCQMSAWPTYPWFNIWGWIAILYLSALYLTVVPFFFFFWKLGCLHFFLIKYAFRMMWIFINALKVKENYPTDYFG